MAFLPKQNGHESARPVEIKHFNEFIKSDGRPFEGRVVRYQPRGEKEVANIAVVPAADAEAFRFWLADEDRAKGFLTNEHHYELEAFSFGDGGERRSRREVQRRRRRTTHATGRPTRCASSARATAA